MARERRESRHPRKRSKEESFEEQGVINCVKHCRDGQERCGFGFCAMEARCGFSKGRFGLVVGGYRLRLAVGEVRADCVGNAFKKLGHDDNWNRVKTSKGDSIKGGF